MEGECLLLSRDLLWDLEERWEVEFLCDSFQVVEFRDPLLDLLESNCGRWASVSWLLCSELLTSQERMVGPLGLPPSSLYMHPR